MKLLIASLLLVSGSAFARGAHVVTGSTPDRGGLALGVNEPDPQHPTSCYQDFVIPPEGGVAVYKLICDGIVMN